MKEGQTNITVQVSVPIKDILKKVAKDSNKTLSASIRTSLGWQDVEVFPSLFTSVHDKNLIQGLALLELPIKSLLDQVMEMEKFTKNKQKLQTLDWMRDKLNFTFEDVKLVTTIFIDEIEKQELEKMHVIYTSFFNFINNVKKDKMTMKKLVKLCKTEYMLEG